MAPGTTVLDLGAGTGKLTRQLVPSGADLVAVEPVAAMRSRLVEVLPTVRALEGSAERIPLGKASVDAVVCAQAFHWFDAPRALAEIHRVLRRRGGLALVWNIRDEAVEWERRLSELLRPYEQNAPRRRWGRWRDAFAETARFTPLQVARFEHRHEADAETMVARVASMSFIAALPDVERARVLASARKLLPDDGPLVMHYRTELYWCRRSD